MYLKQLTSFENIPQGLTQTFHHEFSSSVSKETIIKMYYEKRLTERDLKIAEFLFTFKFATGEQLVKLLGGQTSSQSVIARLDKLVHNKILNKFLLSRVTENRIYPDSLQIYCLDLGGKYLLSNFCNQDTSDWFSSENYKSSDLISKNLITTEFYLRLFEQVDGQIEYFNSAHNLQANKINICPSFEFSLSVDGERTYFLGEVLREYDTPFLFREKAQKLNSLLSTNAWKKFFYDNNQPPFLLLVCENDLLAKEAGQLIENCTEIKLFRITTQERLMKPFHEAGCFMRYISESDELKEVPSKTFHPDNFKRDMGKVALT